MTDGLTRRTILGAGGVLAGTASGGLVAGITTPPAAPAPPASDRDVKSFGAVGDGKSHPLSTIYPTLAQAQQMYPFATSLGQQLDYCGIQAAIDSCYPASTSDTTADRTAIGQVYLSPGTYLVDEQIRVSNVKGLVVHGAGTLTTKLVAIAVRTSVLELIGVSYAHLKDFAVIAAGSTYGIGLHNAPASIPNLATRVTFSRITIGGVFQYGWGSGDTDGSQCDHVCFYDCQVNGNYGPSSSNFQAGWLLGPTSAGDVLDHFFFGCGAGQLVSGIYARACNFSSYGSSFSNCQADFSVGQPLGQTTVEGHRSEGARSLLYVAGPTGAGSGVAIRDTIFYCDNPGFTGEWAYFGAYGHVICENVRILATTVTDMLGPDNIYAAVAQGTYVVAVGLSAPNADPATVLRPGAALTALAYSQNKSGGEDVGIAVDFFGGIPLFANGARVAGRLAQGPGNGPGHWHSALQVHGVATNPPFPLAEALGFDVLQSYDIGNYPLWALGLARSDRGQVQWHVFAVQGVPGAAPVGLTGISIGDWCISTDKGSGIGYWVYRWDGVRWSGIL